MRGKGRRPSGARRAKRRKTEAQTQRTDAKTRIPCSVGSNGKGKSRPNRWGPMVVPEASAGTGGPVLANEEYPPLPMSTVRQHAAVVAREMRPLGKEPKSNLWQAKVTAAIEAIESRQVVLSEEKKVRFAPETGLLTVKSDEVLRECEPERIGSPDVNSWPCAFVSRWGKQGRQTRVPRGHRHLCQLGRVRQRRWGF